MLFVKSYSHTFSLDPLTLNSSNCPLRIESLHSVLMSLKSLLQVKLPWIVWLYYYSERSPAADRPMQSTSWVRTPKASKYVHAFAFGLFSVWNLQILPSVPWLETALLMFAWRIWFLSLFCCCLWKKSWSCSTWIRHTIFPWLDFDLPSQPKWHWFQWSCCYLRDSPMPIFAQEAASPVSCPVAPKYVYW